MTDQPKIPHTDKMHDKNAHSPQSFQERAGHWIDKCFGPEVASDILERQDRFLEEVLELLQAHGYNSDRVIRLRDYVFNREAGDPDQELGGVMLTLAGLCNATGQDMDKAGDIELDRVWTKVEKIRAKQAAKPLFQPEPIPVERHTAWPATTEVVDCDPKTIVAQVIRNGCKNTPYHEDNLRSTGDPYASSINFWDKVHRQADLIAGWAVDALGILGRASTGLGQNDNSSRQKHILDTAYNLPETIIIIADAIGEFGNIFTDQESIDNAAIFISTRLQQNIIDRK